MKKILVAYFSAAGTTRKAAKALAEAADAELYEIRPKVPYTAKDLDWMDPNSRSSLEKKEGAPLPELLDHSANVASYDVILWLFTFYCGMADFCHPSFMSSNIPLSQSLDSAVSYRW